MAEPPEPARAAPSFFPVAASFYLALAVTGVIGLGLARGRLGPELLVDPGSWWTDLGLGLGAGAMLVGLWELGRRLAAGPRRVERELGRLIGELSAGEAAALAVVSAIGEEFAFRGAFQSWIGWVPSAVLFGALHLGPGRHYRWWALWALTGGLGLGLMVDQRGSIGAAIVAHLVVNGIQLQRLRTRVFEIEEPPAETSVALPASLGEIPEVASPEPGDAVSRAAEDDAPPVLEDDDQTQQVEILVNDEPREAGDSADADVREDAGPEPEPVEDDRPTDEIDPREALDPE